MPGAQRERRSLSRSCAARIRSYPSTRERNCARSGADIAAMTASSFCPVKYVLKNSSRVMPSSRVTRSVTVPMELAIGAGSNKTQLNEARRYC